MATLKDFFDENETKPQGRRLPKLNSGTEALADEFLENEDTENNDGDQTDYVTPGGEIQGLSNPMNTLPMVEKVIDRMIRIRGLPPIRPGDKNLSQWSSPDFLEQLVLNALNKSEQKRILRKWRDIRDLSESEGSDAIMKAHADALMIETLMHRSDVENENNPPERTQWNTSTSNVRNIQKTTNAPTRASGILARMFGR